MPGCPQVYLRPCSEQGHHPWQLHKIPSALPTSPRTGAQASGEVAGRPRRYVLEVPDKLLVEGSQTLIQPEAGEEGSRRNNG